MAVGFNLKFSRPQACVRCEPDPSRLASTLLPSGPPAKNGLSRLAGASARSYVRDMKRNFLLAGMLANVLWFPALSHAQDAPASPAAAAAERENTEANFKQVNMKVELLEEALRTQQRRITTLVDEIHTLRQDLDRLKSRSESTATQESIKRLADKIEEVDKKRRDDNELVLAQLKAIGKGLARSTPPKEASPPPANPKHDNSTVTDPNENKPPENGYTYKIKDNDTLVKIVKDLNVQGFKVTQKQIMDANPKVNWTKLRIGQPIFIPQPAP